MKRDDFQLEVENVDKDYRKIKNIETDKFLDTHPGEMESS